LFWSQTGESQVFGPEVLKDAKKEVQIVREILKIAQSRQNSYAGKRRRDLSFEVGEFIYLKDSPMRGTLKVAWCHLEGGVNTRFWNLTKLAAELELPKPDSLVLLES
jgi:hypothetical protein